MPPSTAPSMSMRSRVARAPMALLAAAVVAGCGGGGSDEHHAHDIGLAPSSSYAQVCAAPRSAGAVDPFTGRRYGDVQGSLYDEKLFLRSWIDETYLWYQDVRDLPSSTLDPDRYATPRDYFAVLRSPVVAASGKRKDAFHFFYSTPAWVALAQSGVEYGYGFQIALLAATAPRSAVIAYTDPGTPAAAAGISRGAEIVSVDGIDLANGTNLAGLNAGLFPAEAGSHTFVIREVGSATTRTVTLAAGAIASTPVQNVRTLPAPNVSVGYMLFNDHIATAESQLVAAIDQLKAANDGAGITDLVLDLRYNGGGYLDIASELAYMIAGPARTSGKVFERLVYNDRNPFGLSPSDASTGFHRTAEGFTVPSGTSLPYLGLDRVYVLTSADTCSASEAIINGLRGAGVTVHTVGGTTCGKPYGFYPRDNCNTTYFAIQFKGVNDLGFGDYADGFAPTCAVADDFTKQLGDPTENQLEVALGLRNSGACTAPVARNKRFAQQSAAADETAVLVRSPLRENRIYRPAR